MALPLPMPKSVAPTDNLYKFGALFGLTLIVVASVLIGLRVDRYNERAIAYRSEEFLAKAATTMPSTQTAATNPLAVKSAEELFKESVELAGDKALLDVQLKDLNILLWCGVAISVAGFVGWYFLVQRHQDALLRAKVTKELAALNKPMPSAAEKSAAAEED